MRYLKTMTTAALMVFLGACGSGTSGSADGSSDKSDSPQITMDGLLTKIKTVQPKMFGDQRVGYDIDSWNAVIGKPDSTRGDYKFKRWVYNCSDGILVIEIQNELLHELDAVRIVQKEKKPH